ncbi:MAG: fused MFS/spermidine synthase [Acidobacteriota bacterium]
MTTADRVRKAGPFGLFFFSGMTGLVYEMLWMRELSLLFGNSTQAAAATLAAFFGGLAAGNWHWGRRADSVRRPLRSYALLEAGVAASAVVYFAILAVYQKVYVALYTSLHDVPAVFVVIKFALSCGLLFLPAFFMGGTLPVMSQFLVRQRNALGRQAALLYGINILGAATGVLFTGFLLPRLLGYTNCYLANMALTLVVAAVAWMIDRGAEDQPETQVTPDDQESPSEAAQPLTWNELYVLAAVSGCVTLALQVLWIRMFAQVLQNSVYSYAAILVTFLVALALGGFLARLLGRWASRAHLVLAIVTTAAGLLVATSVHVFNTWTDGLRYIGGDANLVGYILLLFGIAAVVVGVPVTVLGIVLPFSFKLAEQLRASPGDSVGRLVTFNTLGAIVGSVAGGFVLLEWLGLWTSLRMLAGVYLLLAAWLVLRGRNLPRLVQAAPLAALVLLMSVLDTSRLPVVRLDPARRGDSLLQVWEGSSGTVAVIRRGKSLRIKLNNWYTLGGSGDKTTQKLLTDVPIMLHGDPERVFYLGMGTGITAGTALSHPVSEVLVAELVPSVITASRTHFAEHVNGLYTDPRATVLAEDGRNVLRGLDQELDLIISDLFIPWKAGTGTLYAVEHYRASMDRLTPDGLYMQWIPLYQVSEEELAIIARSMLEVFPQVTAWLGSFSASHPVLGLAGHHSPSPLDPEGNLVQASRGALSDWAAGSDDKVPLMAHYVGQLDLEHPRVRAAPVNTDDRPVIDFVAPRNHRLQRARKVQWVEDEHLLVVLTEWFGTTKATSNPYMSRMDPAWEPVINASDYLLMADYLDNEGNDAGADVIKSQFLTLMRNAARGRLRPAAEPTAGTESSEQGSR